MKLKPETRNPPYLMRLKELAQYLRDMANGIERGEVKDIIRYGELIQKQKPR